MSQAAAAAQGTQTASQACQLFGAPDFLYGKPGAHVLLLSMRP